MCQKIPITLTNYAWVDKKETPNSLLNSFFFATYKEQRNDFGYWERTKIPIDLVVDSKKGNRYGFPRGDLGKITRHFPAYDLIDKRAIAPLGFHLKLKEEIQEDERWEEQKRLLHTWARAGGGIIKAPAASGKSVIGVAACCLLSLRTLYLFDKKDLVTQWHQEFYKHTDLAYLEGLAGVPLAGPLKRGKIYPISFATLQGVSSSPMQEYLKAYRDYFGVVICDESHHIAAPTYRNAVLTFNPLIVGGVTATPERKDKLEGIYYAVLGPIVSEGGTEQLNPIVHLHYTGFEVQPNNYYPDFAQWGLFLKQMSRDKDRNQRIVLNVLKDYQEKRCILIISEVVKHCYQLRDLLSEHIDPDTIAVATGQTRNREVIYKDVNRGRYDILIASKVIDEGVSVERLDTCHLVTPTASRARAEQRPGRIRRPLPNKKTPMVHDYIDEGHGMLYGAARIRQEVYLGIGAEVWDTRKNQKVTQLPRRRFS
jgi:superfamily II DNA or RNA helicase